MKHQSRENERQKESQTDSVIKVCEENILRKYSKIKFKLNSESNGKIKDNQHQGKEYVEEMKTYLFQKTFKLFSYYRHSRKTDQSITILASILNEEGRVIANGLAEEFKGKHSLTRHLM